MHLYKITLSLCFLSLLGASAEEKKVADSFYEKEVRPLLEKRCLRCHGGKKRIRGGLRLTSRAGLLKGGDTGPAFLPKSPEKSLLIDVINYGKYKMPPTGKLPQKEIDILTKWAKLNIPGLPEKDAVVHAEEGPPKVDAKAKAFWAFQPVKAPEVPKLTKSGDVSNPIDAFLLAQLEKKGMTFTPPASPDVLVRRLYYDVIGLPPTPKEAQAFSVAYKKNPKKRHSKAGR